MKSSSGLGLCVRLMLQLRACSFRKTGILLAREEIQGNGLYEQAESCFLGSVREPHEHRNGTAE